MTKSYDLLCEQYYLTCATARIGDIRKLRYQFNGVGEYHLHGSNASHVVTMDTFCSRLNANQLRLSPQLHTPYIVENGVTHKDKEIIANKFNHFFTNIAQTLAREIKYDGNKNYMYYLNKRIDTVFTFPNIDEETVRKTIQNLPSKNSCGLDGISSKLIKIIEPAIIKPLTLLINQVLNTGIFPDELKIAKVIPLFKKYDPTLLKNYRPISLLSTIAKVMEKIIFTQLSSYFNEHKLIFDNQYGFRPKHST